MVRRLEEFEVVTTRWLDEMITRHTDEFMRRTIDRTPRLTGNLANGFIREGDSTITNDVSYLEMVEFGTKHMSAAGMIRLTQLEVQEIADEIAAVLQQEIR